MRKTSLPNSNKGQNSQVGQIGQFGQIDQSGQIGWDGQMPNESKANLTEERYVLPEID